MVSWSRRVGSRGAEGRIKAIQYARSHDLPFLGYVSVSQLAVVEYARHVGIQDATSSEFDSEAKNRVIESNAGTDNVRQRVGR